MYPPMVQICTSQMVICLLSVFEAAGNLKAMLTWGIVYLPGSISWRSNVYGKPLVVGHWIKYQDVLMTLAK